MSLVAEFLRSYARLATRRTHATCRALARKPNSVQLLVVAPDLEELAGRLVDHVLLEHLDVCFNQHLSVVVACRWDGLTPPRAQGSMALWMARRTDGRTDGHRQID